MRVLGSFADGHGDVFGGSEYHVKNCQPHPHLESILLTCKCFSQIVSVVSI
jgi:hypothetical protein